MSTDLPTILSLVGATSAVAFAIISLKRIAFIKSLHPSYILLLLFTVLFLIGSFAKSFAASDKLQYFYLLGILCALGGLGKAYRRLYRGTGERR